MAWLSAEREVLQAAITLAIELGFDSYGWQIPWALTTFLFLGRALARLDRYQESYAQLTRALENYRQIGDATGQVNAHLASAVTRYGQDEVVSALSHAQQALRLFERTGNRAGQALALNEAIGHYLQACGVFSGMDRRGDQARVLTNLGDAQLAFGATQAAATAWQQAVAIFDELQHPGAELARGKLRDLGEREAADRAPVKNGHR